MILFSKLRIKHKIALIPLISLCGFLFFLGFSINSNIQNEERFIQIRDQDYPVLDTVNQSWVLLLEIEAIFSNAISGQDKYLAEEANEQANILNNLFAEIDRINATHAIEVAQIRSAFQAYFQTAMKLAEDISKETSLVNSIDINEVLKMHEQYLLFKNLQKNFKLKIEDQFSSKLKTSIVNASTSNKLGISIGIFLIIILAFVSLFISLRITRPLNRVSGAAANIMNGNWDIDTHDLSYQSNDEIGELTHVFSMMESKIKITIAELEEARDFAIAEGKANKEKTIFISNISHELRTPMHAILSFGNLGITRLGKVEDDKIVSYFKYITKSADRLLHLINNLLELANLESRKTELVLTIAELDQMLELVIFEQQEKLDMHKMTVITKISAENLALNIDSNLISQVIGNVIDNAIKYSEDGSKITATIFEQQNNTANALHELCLSIKDEGVGIPENELLDIFDSFSQSSRTSTGAGGTGLGLSISKNIIELHDGKIWAEPNLDDRGVTITFTLPVFVSGNQS